MNDHWRKVDESFRYDKFASSLFLSFFFPYATNSPFHEDYRRGLSETKIQARAREAKETRRGRRREKGITHGVGHRIESRLLVTHSPLFFPRFCSCNHCRDVFPFLHSFSRSDGYSTPPLSRYRPLLRTGMVRLLLPLLLLTILFSNRPPPPVRHFAPRNVSSIAPLSPIPSLSVSPRATILFAGTRLSAFRHGFLSKTFLLEFRPRFFRQSGMEIACPFPPYRLAKVPVPKLREWR